MPAVAMPKWLKTILALLLLPACLGAATALLGRRSAMAATVSVETAISGHYNAQVRELLEVVRVVGAGRPVLVGLRKALQGPCCTGCPVPARVPPCVRCLR